jgi:hypothetical protein
MVPARLALRPGVDPGNASSAIADCLLLAGNLAGSATGPDPVAALRASYLEWVEATELQLAALTPDPRVIGMLRTDAHWYIRRMGRDEPRPHPLVVAEIGLQAAELRRLADDLSARVQRLAGPAGHITILDANVLLEYQEPASIAWPEILNVTPVRLVVPLRVVEEIDEKKYARRDDLARRARRLLPQLEALVGPDGSPGPLRENVTIELLADPGPRDRPADGDSEVIATAMELRQLTGRPATIVTGDTGMRLRAQAAGLPVTSMPDKYLRRSPDGT